MLEHGVPGMRVLALAAATVALSACIYVDGDGFDRDYDDWRRPGLVPLYGASVGADGVHIRAPSNGCTAEDSFNVVTYPAGGGPGNNTFHVRFERLSPDRCRARMPDGVELTYSFTRLGLPSDATIVFDNPINR